jgi:hypothetical protein
VPSTLLSFCLHACMRAYVCVCIVLLESNEPSVAIAAVRSIPDLAAALTGRLIGGSGPGCWTLDPASEAACFELLPPLLGLVRAAVAWQGGQEQEQEREKGGPTRARGASFDAGP